MKNFARYITAKIDVAPDAFFLFVAAIIAFCLRMIAYIHYFLTWRVIFVVLFSMFLYGTCVMQ